VQAVSRNTMTHIMTRLIVLLVAAVGAGWSAAALPAQTKVGDSWTYEARDGFNGKLNTTYRIEVTGVSSSEIDTAVTNLGTKAVSSERFTPDWNPLDAEWATLRRYQFTPYYPEYPDKIEPGVDWKQIIESRDPATSQQMKMKIIGKVLGRERITVPAGQFDCIKIGRDTILDDAQFWRGPTRVWETEWYSSELHRSVKYETRSQYREEGGRNSMRRGDWTIFELSAYKAAANND
jgi:hypothetical protein